MMAPTAVLVLFTIGMGLWAQPFLRLADDAARDILNPRGYVASVLGTVPARGTPR
jgi:multicomponent Na+:H+ antiporter subunit D